METVAQRVDRLEQVMIKLAEQSKITQREVARLSTEMLEFKDEMREFKREMNKRWGELANKMGTLVEDIVAPNISGIAREYFGCSDIKDFTDIFLFIYIPEDLVTYLTKNRIYAMAMKDDTMDLLNFEQVIDDVKKG